MVGAARGPGDQVKGVADYETAMTRIIERTQATREEQDLLAQAVQNAQRELGVTAAVSADALLRMVKDGFSHARQRMRWAHRWHTPKPRASTLRRRLTVWAASSTASTKSRRSLVSWPIS